MVRAQNGSFYLPFQLHVSSAGNSWEKCRDHGLVGRKLVWELLGDLSPFMFGKPIVSEDQEGPEYQRDKSRPLEKESDRNHKEPHILWVADVTVNARGNQVLTFALVNQRPACIEKVEPEDD